MRSAIAFLTPEHPVKRKWGAPDQSPILSTMVSRQAMTMDYTQLHSGSEVEQLDEAEIARQWRAFDEDEVHQNHRNGSNGNNSKHNKLSGSWVSWLKTPARVFRSSTSSSSHKQPKKEPPTPMANGGAKKASRGGHLFVLLRR